MIKSLTKNFSFYGSPYETNLLIEPETSHIGKNRKDVHLARKLWHAVTGLFLVGLYVSPLNKQLLLSSIGSLFCMIVTVESLRLKAPEINATIIRYFGIFMRKHETRTMSTMPHYLFATLMAFALFPKDIAVLSVLFLACADPIASFMGIQYGHFGPQLTPTRSLIGTLSGIAICTSITFLLCSHLPFTTRCIVTAVGGIAGGLSELAPIEVDDNLTIPLISGFILWLVFIILGI